MQLPGPLITVSPERLYGTPVFAGTRVQCLPFVLARAAHREARLYSLKPVKTSPAGRHRAQVFEPGL